MTSLLNLARVKRPLMWQTIANACGVGTESPDPHEEGLRVSRRGPAEKLERFRDYEDARSTVDGESGASSIKHNRQPRVVVAWIGAEVVCQAAATFRVVN